jgi:hypothetical protein
MPTGAPGSLLGLPGLSSCIHTISCLLPVANAFRSQVIWLRWASIRTHSVRILLGFRNACSRCLGCNGRWILRLVLVLISASLGNGTRLGQPLPLPPGAPVFIVALIF